MNSTSTPVIQADRALIKESSRSGSEQNWILGEQASNGLVAVFVLAQVRMSAALWGIGRFAWNRLDLKKIPGVVFYKHLGSGYEGGFGLRPSLDRQGLFLVFSDQANAQNFIDTSSLLKRYREYSKEVFTVLLHPYAVKGQWSGFQPTPTRAAPEKSQLIATLTRASIRPSKAAAFWRDAKPAHDAMQVAQGCQLAAGVGEAPFFRQATFTIWDNVAAMNTYAREGAHQAAIRTSYGNNYFSESMFVRFIAENAKGQYKGVHYGG